MVSISQICKETGFDRSALNRYLDVRYPENREIFGGAESHPNYPEESLQVFAWVWSEHQAKKITPQTLAGWYKNTIGANPDSVSDIRIPDNTPTGGTLVHMPEQAVDLIEKVLQHTAARWAQISSPPPDDCLINVETAASILCCSLGSVRRMVAPVKRGRWRKSDILRYIQDLKPIGRG